MFVFAKLDFVILPWLKKELMKKFTHHFHQIGIDLLVNNNNKKTANNNIRNMII